MLEHNLACDQEQCVDTGTLHYEPESASKGGIASREGLDGEDAVTIKRMTIGEAAGEGAEA